MRQAEIASKDKVEALVEGKLPDHNVKELIRLAPKDKDRFWKYLEILQSKVPWKDKILLRISDHLFIVANEDGGRVVKCDCGHEFGDYRINWKFNARVYVRRTREEMAEVISVEESILNPNVVEMREFYCPGCFAQLAVEVVPIGYPPLLEIFPDLDTFYRDWLGVPLDDEDPGWYQEKTSELTSQWSKEG
ncbi:acetone carboxylase subunit gamma [Chloroflexota bacterium]